MALGLAIARVVVLGSFGDQIEGLAVLTRSHLSDRKRLEDLSSAGSESVGGLPHAFDVRRKAGVHRRQGIASPRQVSRVSAP